MIGIANSSMMSVHAMMIERVATTVVASLTTMTVATIVTVMMEAAIRGEDIERACAPMCGFGN
jgi:hypothetical protein